MYQDFVSFYWQLYNSSNNYMSCLCTLYRKYTVKEVLDALEDHEDFASADIFIDPPRDGVDSEEDSGDEDEGGNMNNLSGRQLMSACHGRLRTRSNEIVEMGGEDLATGDDEFSGDPVECDDVSEVADSVTIIESAAKAVTTTKRKTLIPRKWVKKDIQPNWPDFNIPEKSFTIPLDPVRAFEFFFDDDICTFLAEMTTLYGREVKHDHAFETDAEEIRCFLAILLLSGYVDVPRWRMFWEVDTETFNSAVSRAMRRNRFDTIKRYLHCSDNSHLPDNDRFGKMRSLMTMLNERYLNFAKLKEHVCVDESMAPYYGKHGAKQYIHGKPVKFGFKFWCLCDRFGYLIQFDPYQGASGPAFDKNIGLGASVVLDLVSELPSDVPFKIFGDRYFSSPKLLQHLLERGFGYTGTVMVNRTEKCPVSLPKKSTRGSMDYRTDVNTDSLVVAWNDHSPVHILSNVYGVNPNTSCLRWNKSEKKKIPIDMPFLVSMYNTYMGGVDRMDQNIGNYRVAMRSKKWWWAVFVFCLETSVHNAWQLYRESTEGKEMPLDLLKFRRNIVLTYLQKYGVEPTTSGRPAESSSHKTFSKKVLRGIRFDSKSHYLVAASKQNRCANCKKNTKKKCAKCNINLHESCFPHFHKTH